jgi:hypothetical protein
MTRKQAIRMLIRRNSEYVRMKQQMGATDFMVTESLRIFDAALGALGVLGFERSGIDGEDS